MTNAFVYVIGWRSLDRWYGGVRYKANCKPDDLWTLYHTSSKHVAKFRSKHGEPDVIRVLKTFGNDLHSARLYEQHLLRRVNALHSERWLNRAVGGHFAGRRGPHTEETKRKIGEKATGRKLSPCTEERKQKQRATFMRNYEANREARFAARSAKQKGRIITPEMKQKISITLTGTKLSEETKRKISEGSKRQSVESRQKCAASLRGRKWFTNGQEVVRAYICPTGFRPGRK